MREGEKGREKADGQTDKQTRQIQYVHVDGIDR